MGVLNKILTAGNLRLKVTNLFGLGKLTPHDTIEGLPIGTLGGTATGELGVKVHVISQAAGAGGLTDGELRASAVPVTVSGVALASRQPVVSPSQGTGIMDAGTQRVTLATDGPGIANLSAIAAVEGVTNGVAVVTNANGTIQQYLRGLVTLWLGGLASGENYVGRVGGTTARVAVTFTRPSDTTAYAVGDLVANSTTAGSVAPMSFAISRATGRGGMLRRVRVRKTGTSITNASFRVHLYSVSPTVSNGDNGVWLSNQAANYVGACDVSLATAFTDGVAGNGVPNAGSEINFTSDTFFAIVEARGAYTPVSAEQFTVELELLQN